MQKQEKQSKKYKKMKADHTFGKTHTDVDVMMKDLLA